MKPENCLGHATKKILTLISGIDNPRIVLGLSGGPDSVFLFHALREAAACSNIYFVAAHLDHGWRNESADDAAWCQELCKQYDIPYFYAHRTDMPEVITNNGSIEGYGRALRRAFFHQVFQTINAHFIALAHHANDQRETFFIRLIRGSSLDGLCGIKEQDGAYIRPLLDLEKQDILNYLHEHNYTYRIDASNDGDDFLRNKLRHHIMPALQACDERFEKKCSSTMHHLAADNALLQHITQETFARIFAKTSESWHYQGDCSALLLLHPALKKRVLCAWLVHEQVPFTPSAGHLEEIERFLINTKSSYHALSNYWGIRKKASRCWIEKKE